MPYRRLPNTDLSRIRALESALKKGETILPFNLSFSQATLHKLKFFLPTFKENIEMNKIAYARYSQKSEVYAEMQKKAKIYISHFIQVVNFAIQRGDLPINTRDYYGIDSSETKIPQLNSDKEILSWGNKIITGEAKRVSKGLNPITNPTIAVVKVYFEKFEKANRTQKTLNEASQTAQEKLKNKRVDANELIIEIWNEIEKSLDKYSANEKREKAEKYGLVYVYRKHEKEHLESVSYN